MVSKITVAALVLIVAVPTMLGYALSFEYETTTGWSSSDTYNVTDTMINAVTPYYIDSYAPANNSRIPFTYSINGYQHMANGTPAYNKVGATPTSLPIFESTYHNTMTPVISSFTEESGTTVQVTGTMIAAGPGGSIPVYSFNGSAIKITTSDTATLQYKGGTTTGTVFGPFIRTADAEYTWGDIVVGIDADTFKVYSDTNITYTIERNAIYYDGYAVSPGFTLYPNFPCIVEYTDLGGNNVFYYCPGNSNTVTCVNGSLSINGYNVAATGYVRIGATDLQQHTLTGTENHSGYSTTRYGSVQSAAVIEPFPINGLPGDYMVYGSRPDFSFPLRDGKIPTPASSVGAVQIWYTPVYPDHTYLTDVYDENTLYSVEVPSPLRGTAFYSSAAGDWGAINFYYQNRTVLDKSPAEQEIWALSADNDDDVTLVYCNMVTMGSVPNNGQIWFDWISAGRPSLRIGSSNVVWPPNPNGTSHILWDNGNLFAILGGNFSNRTLLASGVDPANVNICLRVVDSWDYHSFRNGDNINNIPTYSVTLESNYVYSEAISDSLPYFTTTSGGDSNEVQRITLSDGIDPDAGWFTVYARLNGSNVPATLHYGSGDFTYSATIGPIAKAADGTYTYRGWVIPDNVLAVDAPAGSVFTVRTMDYYDMEINTDYTFNLTWSAPSFKFTMLDNSTTYFGISWPEVGINHDFTLMKSGTAVTITDNTLGIDVYSSNNIQEVAVAAYEGNYNYYTFDRVEGQYADPAYGWKLDPHTDYSGTVTSYWSNGSRNESIRMMAALDNNESLTLQPVSVDGTADSFTISRMNDLIYVGEEILGKYSRIQILLTGEGAAVSGIKNWPEMTIEPNVLNTVNVDFTDKIPFFTRVKLVDPTFSVDMRVDDARIEAGEFPVIRDSTLTPSQLWPDRSYSLAFSSAGIYGDILEFAGTEYTVQNGSIQVNGVTVPLLKAVFTSVKEEDGSWTSSINNQQVSSGAPADLYLGGDWSVTVQAFTMEEVERNEYTWQPGNFAFNGLDNSFALLGLLTTVGVFIGLGLYGRRSGAKVGTLMLVCGACAAVFLCLIV